MRITYPLYDTAFCFIMQPSIVILQYILERLSLSPN
jgi:hypothetical protein